MDFTITFCPTFSDNDHRRRTEDMVVELMAFLQIVYLLYTISFLVSTIRWIFSTEIKTTKVCLSFTSHDGAKRNVIHIDTQLLKAASLCINFMMFYMVPVKVSCFIYFFLFRQCIIGALDVVLSRRASTKTKHE